MNINEIRMGNGKLPKYSWPGAYPVYYTTLDNGVLCAKCANGYQPERDNQAQLEPIAYDCNWEDETLLCDHCNTRIESAYGR